MFVAEGNQRLVPTAVMPVQVGRKDTGDKAFVEDALLIGNRLVRFLVRLDITFLKEAGRRHLLRITDNNQLLPASDDTNGIPDGYLRRLVKHDEIKRCRIDGQILGNRKRAHEEAGLQCRNQHLRFGEYLPNRLLTGLLFTLALEHSKFRPLGTGPAPTARQRCGQLRKDDLSGERSVLTVELPETTDPILLAESSELGENGRLVKNRVQHLPRIGIVEYAQNVQFPVILADDVVDKCPNAKLNCPGLCLPVAQNITQIGNVLRQPLARLFNAANV